MDAATKIRIDALKTETKKVTHKAAEARGKFSENKIANKIVKPKREPDENSRMVEEIIIPPNQKEKISTN